MKEMFRSLRIFTGGYTIKNMLLSAAAFVVMFGAMSLLSIVEIPEGSFIAGFFAGFIPAFSMFIPLLGAFVISAVYSYNTPLTPGYKYFHSMRDGEERYVRAILAANLVALIIIIIAVLLQLAVFVMFGSDVSPTSSAAIALIVTGLINLLGNTRRQWLRTVIMVPVFVIAGMAFGFSAALTEDGESMPEIVILIAMAVAVVVYVVGLVYTMATSAKKWRISE